MPREYDHDLLIMLNIFIFKYRNGEKGNLKKTNVSLILFTENLFLFSFQMSRLVFNWMSQNQNQSYPSRQSQTGRRQCTEPIKGRCNNIILMQSGWTCAKKITIGFGLNFDWMKSGACSVVSAKPQVQNTSCMRQLVYIENWMGKSTIVNKIV